MDSSPTESNRPYTNEGLAPVPPGESRKSSRSYRTVSPRQITLYERSTAPATASSGPAPPSARRNLRSKQQQNRAAAEDYTCDSVEDDAPARLFEYTGNDFLKLTPHTHVFMDRPTTASVRSSQFPTLSDRLKAQITVSSQVSQDVRHTFQQQASAPTQPPTQQSAQATHRKQAMLRNYSSDTNASAASVDFQSMNVRELLQYLLQADDGYNADESTFVHVTSRYNIEYVPKPDFYDLVVLERPGQPKSGYVWTRDNPKYTPDYHVLPAPCIMQLSLKGLLVTNEDNGHLRSEMITLPAFFHEKANFDQLRKLRFFGFFRELRVFKAWHVYTQHVYINRMRDILMKDSYFSDNELMKMQGQIAKITYEMEIDLEVFVFHGRGSVCVTDYFNMQLQQIEFIKSQLTARIGLIAQAVETQHGVFMNSKKLEDLIQEVKDHHPLRNEMRKQEQEALPESAEQKVDWIRLRSIQRLRDNFMAKIKRLLRMAQYRVEFKVALLLERFWLRFKQFIVGVPDLRKANHRRKEDMTYWEIDYNLFTPTGAFQPTAFDYNIGLHDEQNAKKEHEQEIVDEMHMHSEHEQAPLYKLETFEGTPCYGRINKDWESAGSHLCVRVELHYNNRVAELNDFIGLHNIDSMSVCITPTKSVLLNQIHSVCGSLGRLIQNLPDLSKHALIYTPDYKPVYKEPDVDLGLGELDNSNSGIYFTTLIMKPIFNSRHAYQLAIDSIRLVNQAYNEATSIDSFTFKLYEVVRKLWSLSPASVVKQIERSVAVPKIRTFIEMPDSVEDLKRSQARDKSRLISFKTASTYLDKLPHDLDKYCNLKHRIGFITSFTPLLEQISSYRAIQTHYLLQRLPTSYATRCTIFYELLRRLEIMFDAQNKSTMELIEVMRKLKHFDAVKENFDCEVEFCHTMYTTILQAENKRNQGEITLQELKVAQLLASKTRSHAPTVSPEKLQRVFQETLERMAVTLARLRSYLLTQLVDVKEAILSGRQKIRLSIRTVQESIENFEFMMQDEEPGTNIAKQYDVSGFGDDITKLRKQVDESVAAQLLLLEAHDIVGAANMILLPNQVDQFSELEGLEKVYTTKCQVGDILRSIHSLNETIWTSRMSLVNPFEVNRSFTSIISSYTHLQVHLPDAELLEMIENKIKKLSPRVELVVYLPSKTVKPRHWQLLAAHVFKNCGLEIKLSGRQSEFVALVDVTGREPVNMGNVSRLAVKDFLTRLAR
ncbi:hypothetical protein EON65_02070 [archaeon]|nr:MAG: hypothetical protein EON65_02070 [archaeon]